MGELTFLLGARVVAHPGQEREIVLGRPGLSPAWRAGLPALLDQRPTSAALVEYVVKLYFRQLPLEAELTGWATLTTVVRAALMQANGEQAEEAWEYGQVA